MREAEQTDYPGYCSSIESALYVQCDEVRWLYPAKLILQWPVDSMLYVFITENSWGILNNFEG